MPVDERDLHGGIFQAASQFQPAKACADDDNVGEFLDVHGCLLFGLQNLQILQLSICEILHNYYTQDGLNCQFVPGIRSPFLLSMAFQEEDLLNMNATLNIVKPFWDSDINGSNNL